MPSRSGIVRSLILLMSMVFVCRGGAIMHVNARALLLINGTRRHASKGPETCTDTAWEHEEVEKGAECESQKGFKYLMKGTAYQQ